MAEDKKRFDYGQIGLVKKNDEVLYEGISVDDLPTNSKSWLSHYGAFVFLTRSLAGHEKDSLADKKAIVAEQFQWLVDGMPEKTRKNAVKVDAFVDACRKVMASDAPASTKAKTIEALEAAYGREFVG